MKRDVRKLKWAIVNGYKYVECDDEGNIKGYGFSRQTLEYHNLSEYNVMTIRQYEKATKEEKTMKSTDKPTNLQVAVYLANQYRSKVTDEKLRTIAKMYNFKYQVLKRNYDGICKINDVFNNEQQ